MAKDWVGGNAAVFKTLGASNHKNGERQREDYYATEPAATEWLCKIEQFTGGDKSHQSDWKQSNGLQTSVRTSTPRMPQPSLWDSKKKNRQGELCNGERANCIAQIAIPRASTIPAEKFGGGNFQTSHQVCLITPRLKFRMIA